MSKPSAYLTSASLPALHISLHPETAQSLDTLTETLNELDAPLMQEAEQADEQWKQWRQVPAFLRCGVKAQKIGKLLSARRQHALDILAQAQRRHCSMVPSVLVVNGELDLCSLVAIAEA